MIKRDSLPSRDQVLNIVKQEGPLLPSKVSSLLKTSILFASATLSELSSSKKVKVSHLKIGGSPLYYVDGQEEKLQDYSGRIHEKEQRAYEMLKEKGVLRDKDIDTLNRVALRNIKDFAVPLDVVTKDSSELFWKWYLLPDEDCRRLIAEILDREKQPEIKEPARVEEPEDDSGIKKFKVVEETKVKADEGISIEPMKMESGIEAPIVEPAAQQELKLEEPELKAKEEPREAKKKLKKKKAEVREKEINKISESARAEIEKDASIKKVEETREMDFMDVITNYFKANKIEVIETTVIKDSEIDFILEVPSAVGKVRYYCKSRDKKRINEGDLSSAYVQGQAKNLPVFFLTKGKLTKRASRMLEESLKNITFKTLQNGS